MYKPNSLWTWSFVCIAFAQAGVILALESYAFATFEKDLQLDPNDPNASHPTYPPRFEPYTRSVPVSLALYIFGMLYELVLVWDALRLKNTIQIIGICMCNFGLVIYGALQPIQIRDAVGNLMINERHPDIWRYLIPSLIVIPCILLLGTVLMSFVAWKLYDEFSWTIYKHISADLRMKRRYLTYQIYIALLKFDFFFFLGFTIQFLVVVVDTTDAEFGLTVAAVPITIGILLMAGFWTRRENHFGMIFTIVLYFAALAYFIFKLIRIWNGDKVPEYQPVSKPLTAFAVITILLIVGTIINAVQCSLNFNKGLKPHIANRKVESEEEKAYMTEMPNLAHGQVPSRMTID